VEDAELDERDALDIDTDPEVPDPVVVQSSAQEHTSMPWHDSHVAPPKVQVVLCVSQSCAFPEPSKQSVADTHAPTVVLVVGSRQQTALPGQSPGFSHLCWSWLGQLNPGVQTPGIALAGAQQSSCAQSAGPLQGEPDVPVPELETEPLVDAELVVPELDRCEAEASLLDPASPPAEKSVVPQWVASAPATSAIITPPHERPSFIGRVQFRGTGHPAGTPQARIP
jgi:hypothetical protein